jgi:preprotein translocase subunit SecG
VETIVWVTHVFAAVVLVGLVLMQHGKGADMGAAFGTGSAGSVFGSTGSANFLSRSTAVAAALFFSTSLSLTYLYSNPTESQGVMDNVAPVTTESTSVAPAVIPDDDSKSKEIPR